MVNRIYILFLYANVLINSRKKHHTLTEATGFHCDGRRDFRQDAHEGCERKSERFQTCLPKGFTDKNQYLGHKQIS